MKSRWTVMLLLCSALLSACGREPAAPPAKPAAAAPAPSNRIDIPANVRQNLGLTFAKVESRPVSRTLRLPGAFELLPTARREYRAVAGGRVELLIGQYDRVEPGRLLARIDSPRLREVQQQLADAVAGVALAQAAVDSMPPFFDAHEKHHSEIEKSVGLWAERVKQLNDLRTAGGGQAAELATANASLATARASFAETLEKEAELNVRQKDATANLAAARQKHDLLLSTLASLTGRPADALLKNENGGPAWASLTAIEVRATAAGVVSLLSVTSGAYVDASAPLLTVVAPEQIRFRARGYQSDLGRLSNGLAARVVPPAGVGIDDTRPMTGPLLIAPQAAADSRTIDLIVVPQAIAPWAIDGVSGFVEITLAGATAPELAVPTACVVRDGLTPVLFRRDPRDPDKAIRIEADVGVSDGRWVVIQSGVAEGNDIVHDGAYQLLVATSGSIAKGGHFHADGTFHEAHEGED